MTSFVAVVRGDLLESRHEISAAVVDADGTLVAGCGDPDRVAFWRSCAKPFQAAPAVAAGAADALGVDEEELALACASHNGETRHVAVARRLLAHAGADESALVCGPHASLNDEVARAMAGRGERPGRVHSNCSGKHGLMLAFARHAAWDAEGYARPAHQLQRRALAEVAAWTGLDPARIPFAADGCGVPSFALPLRRMALAWARLGAAGAGDAVDAVPASSVAGMRRLVHAMRAHPFLVAGTARLDTDLIGGSGGRVISKVGAEGVYCAAVPELRVALALKVEDGASRALEPALLGLLDIVAPGVAPPLEAYRSPPIRNTLGDTVGRIEARVDLRRDAAQR